MNDLDKMPDWLFLTFFFIALCITVILIFKFML